jgi:hypothetical protein
MGEELEWSSVYRRLIAEGRERVGDPPTADEVDALFRGDLSEEEAARVRGLLLYYPEIARVMTQPSPPEVTNVLTDEERAQDWEAIRRRIAPSVPISPPIRRPNRRPRLLAYAAAAALAYLGIILYFEFRPAAPAGLIKPPLVARRIERRELRPDGILRGSAPTPAIILAAADEYALNLLTTPERGYASYRMDVVDLNTARVIWTRPGIADSPNGAFEVHLSSRVLRPGGRYELVLYGMSSRVATYTVRVLAR